MKTAFVTGAYGQDGSYLIDLLLGMGYQVIGGRRRSSYLNTARLDYFKALAEGKSNKFQRYTAEYIDMTDSASISAVLDKYRPDEIYNLAAQSHVGISFELPEYTAQVNGVGFLRLLESVRAIRGYHPRIYQASTSELYGAVKGFPQTETTPFCPISPYAIAKHFAHQIAVEYRNSHGMWIACGILFNHESPLRGGNFVTQKIVTGALRFLDTAIPVDLGNLDSKRDWGHALDYVKMQHLMLQQPNPDDYVIATGEQESVRGFVERVFHFLGMTIIWQGQSLQEKGIVSESKLSEYDHLVGREAVVINEANFRPHDVVNLLGDSSKAKNQLGWCPESGLDVLVREMIEYQRTVLSRTSV